DDAIARRKILRRRRCIQRQLADDDPTTLLHNPLVQAIIFRRVGIQQPAAGDNHRAAVGLQSSEMCRGIDAAGAARDDGEAGLSELSREALRLLAAVERAAASANHADCDGIRWLQLST